MKEFKPTWLYVKQHNKTGLKYFGKTVQEPVKYKGSGLHWTRHLNKHGNDVSTVWCELFTDKESLIEFALFFSNEFNITQSSNWANLKSENGIDGNPVGVIITDETKGKMSLNASRPKTTNWKKSASNNRKGRIAWNKGVPHTEETKKKISELNPRAMLGKKHSDSAKRKMSDARKGKLPSNKGIARSEEQKLAQSLKMKGRIALNKGVPAKLATCEFCGKTSTVGAIGRYHKSCGK